MKPYYQEKGITIYHADCREVLPSLPPVDLVLTDPPYSSHTHAKQWIGHALTADGDARCSTAFKELGFQPIDAEMMSFICDESKRLAQRWTLLFSDLETVALWRAALTSAGLDYVRCCV